MIQEALEEARRLAHENRLEGKDLNELAELEDDEDDDFLEHYRNKRMQELSTINAASVYNQVYHLQKPDYSRDVTEASSKAYILVLLTSSHGTNGESRIMIDIWRELAQRFGDVKFCQMRADLCIEGYPEKNTPTVLIYKDGDIKKQLVTLRELRGTRTNAQDVEQLLVDISAVRIGDARLSRNKAGADADASRSKIRQSAVDPDDSDWD
ncbi:hypothetical protein PMIN03_009947 [Paraphaeosphaeria minitans]